MTLRPHTERDLTGYGRDMPHPRWPGEARVAVQFVLNYEEGGELTPLNGDDTSEPYMNEVDLGQPIDGRRNSTSESLYGYGARSGFWRTLRLFEERELPLTAFVVGKALELNPAIGEALAAGGHELAGHGYRWVPHARMPIEMEREHIGRTYDVIERVTGEPPVGWFTGRVSPNTRQLVVEHGGFQYDSDAYDDDLPYWVDVAGKEHLIIPYTFDVNDMKFTTTPGFAGGRSFADYLCDGFDMLYAEGADQPKMLSVGLHPRVIGRPSRAQALARFLDYVVEHDRVWVCTRRQICDHWTRRFPPTDG